MAGLSNNPGAEIIRYGRGRPDLLSLGQGEGDAPTPAFVMEGARRAMEEGKTFYGPVLGLDAMRQEVCSYYQKIYGLFMDPARIFMTGSGTTAMHFALTALLEKGDEVVAITPIWKNLLGAVELAQARVREVPLYESETGWHLDMDRLLDACSEKTRAVLITTPSNPTGWIMSREEMETLLAFTRKHGIWIICDEVYGRITYEASRAPSFLEVASPEDLLFTVNSFSKSWAMTGWRLGWLTGPAAAESAIRDIALYNNLCPPGVTQYAGIEALRHGEDFIAGQIAGWRKNRDMVCTRLDTMRNVRFSIPDSTFYAFFKTEGEADCVMLAKRLIDEAGLQLAPGCAFGKETRGYIRLCFAVSQERLSDALDRLEQGLAR